MVETKASSGICSVIYVFGAHLQSGNSMCSSGGAFEQVSGKSTCSCNSEMGSSGKESCSELFGVFSELFGVFFFLMTWENFRISEQIKWYFFTRRGKDV